MSSLAVPVWTWVLLAVIVCVSVSIDLFAHRGDRVDSKRRALVWSIFWIVLALAFNVFVAFRFGRPAGEQFLAAYLLEKSLSVDNLFVFLLVFTALRIPITEQRRVLTWGIAGAILTRGVLIFAGAAAVQRWHEVNYVFAALLLFAAWRTFRDDPSDDSQSPIVGWLARHLPVTETVHGKRFLAVENGRRVATPLLLAVVALELTDVMFAIDSVPAAFSVADSTFVIYSSNAFAILGLRSLYIVLAKYLRKLVYLHYGLAVILAFAAIKIALSEWVHVPAAISVGIIAVVIALAIGASLLLDSNDD